MTLRPCLLALAACASALVTGCAVTDPSPPAAVTISNSGNSLFLQTATITGARLIGDLSIVFSDESHMRVESLLASDLGYDLDIREYPAYLLGLRELEEARSLSEAEADEILAARMFLLEHGKRKPLSFSTPTGLGYAALGREDHFLFLVRPDNPRAITQIHMTGISRDRALERVLQGIE